jgi:hypothetical protein
MRFDKIIKLASERNFEINFRDTTAPLHRGSPHAVSRKRIPGVLADLLPILGENPDRGCYAITLHFVTKFPFGDKCINFNFSFRPHEKRL